MLSKPGAATPSAGKNRQLCRMDLLHGQRRSDGEGNPRSQRSYTLGRESLARPRPATQRMRRDHVEHGWEPGVGDRAMRLVQALSTQWQLAALDDLP